MKIIRTLALILLVILPYSTALSHFSPYLTAHSFSDFVWASLVYGALILALGRFISVPNTHSSGFGLLALGALIGPPLMLGPPELGENLLNRVTEEHFRFGLLMAATLLLAVSGGLLLRKIKGPALLWALLVLSVVLQLWDNYSSYHLSNEMRHWIQSGKNPAHFIMEYPFHQTLRTLGRSLIYLLIPAVSWILWKKGSLKKGIFMTLTVFCAAGIVFFFLFNFQGFDFYFPFMIPAVALAPAYWLGIALVKSWEYNSK